MAYLKYEGDINNISSKQLEFISSVLEERGYTDGKIVIESVGKDGDNYAANVKRIRVEKNGENFNMIAKIATGVEALRVAMNTELLFHNEHVMYTEILPKFAKLQLDACVPDEERLRYANCYGSFTEAPHEVILLEDLLESGFTILNRFEPFDDETVKLVLKNFAILHSLSLVLKHFKTETFLDLITKLRPMWTTVDNVPETRLYLDKLENDVMQMLQDVQHNEFIKDSLKLLGQNAVRNHEFDSQSNYYSVIHQGDCSTNNIMFILKDGKPVKCCLIDYQLAVESSPAADLHYLLFSCTDHQMRLKHYREWINYYYSALGKALSHFDLKAYCVYPRENFDEDLKRYARFSFGQCILVSSVLMRESGEASKYKEALENLCGDDDDAAAEAAQVSNLDEKTISRFRKRMIGLLESYSEFGYF